MNIFLTYKKTFDLFLNKLKSKNIIDFPGEIKNLTVEVPPKQFDADMSCNAAMILSKYDKKTPLEIAEVLKEHMLKEFTEFKKIEIANKGFINITFNIDFWQNFLIQVISLKNKYGSYSLGIKKYNLEFVSANPTGPLHVGHCRGAIIGDTIANLLKFNGNLVTKEYYVNDHGNQINSYIKSIYYRILEIVEKKPFPKKEDLYPGDYIIDIAKKIISAKSIKDFSSYGKIYDSLRKESLKISVASIKENLKMLGVVHDNFVYESSLIKDDLVKQTIELLKKSKYIYNGELKPPKGDLTRTWKSRDQLLFRSTDFGDDVDRPLQKEDGSWTYFASDIAYHAYKINRGFDNLINILGADHAGYIKRITAATKAISQNKQNFICKVSQLVKLSKKGKPFKMSKRTGDYITVEDLINEVGRDSVRFMMLSRSNDVELEFDFEKVTEKSKENPVFYVQYAYARINSIFKSLDLDLNDSIVFKDKRITFNKYEIQILKKISEWPKCVELSSTKFEPHRITFYLYELATLFHSYWSLGKENEEFRFILNKKKNNPNRLLLLQALSTVIKNGMSVLGVSTPSSM
jgi:arginyl-tRNA synthetase